MKKSRVLHISNFYPPNIGGVEQVAYDVVSTLAGSNYEQEVICFDGNGKFAVDYVEGVKVTRVGYFLKVFSQALSLSYYFHLRNAIKRLQPEYIHFHWPNPLVAIFLLLTFPKSNCRLIVHWHSDIIKQERILWLFQSIQDRILKLSETIIVTSPNYASSSHLSNWVNKIKVVPNTVDISRFVLTQKEENELAQLKERFVNTKVVLFLGRHVEYKGVEYLIKASKKMTYENVKILIAGSGPLTTKLKQESSNDNKIEFIGRIDDQQLKLYFHLADVFAFPSITKNEAFGVALAEAMCCETASITYEIEGSGVNWVNKKDVTGIEVPNRDVKAFAAGLDQLLSNDELRTSMAKLAKERVERKFNKTKLAAYLNPIYAINELNN